jgi:hypothetical protein
MATQACTFARDNYLPQLIKTERILAIEAPASECAPARAKTNA